MPLNTKAPSGFVVGKDHTLVLNFGANKTTAFLDGKQVFTRECTLAGSYADCSKAKEMLGWEAKLNMEDMCRDGWNFIKNNPNGL